MVHAVFDSDWKFFVLKIDLMIRIKLDNYRLDDFVVHEVIIFRKDKAGHPFNFIILSGLEYLRVDFGRSNNKKQAK